MSVSEPGQREYKDANNKQHSTKKKNTFHTCLTHWWEIDSFKIAEEKIKLRRMQEPKG